MSDAAVVPETPKCSSLSVVIRLEQAIKSAVEFEVGENSAGCELLAAAGEALGALKVMGDISVSQYTYDLARVAASAGWVPDDFDQRAMQ